MRIAVLSGKGGTGKTLVSVNLAAVAGPSTYVDCDIEEPNGHLFFKPVDVEAEQITVKIPVVDHQLCNGCRKCVEFCNFNSLAYINRKLIVFEDICHSCGGCVLVCPEKALTEKEKAIGTVQAGRSGDVQVYSGIMQTGEASGIPIIDRLLEKADNSSQLTVIDCPPGSACSVMESIKDADFCILVTEPTLFGVHNLNLVYELVQLFNKPFGAVLNKCIDGESPDKQFCLDHKINIIGEIAFDQELGELTSNGMIASRENDKYRQIFASILESVKKEVSHETIAHS